MVETIPRRDPYINELVLHLDAKFQETKGDAKAAWAKLTSDEVKLISTELERVSGPDPTSVRYYLENYHVINTKGGEDAPPQYQTLYPFKETQELLWEDFILCWELKIPVFWVLLKARQIGWSTLVQAIILARTIFNKRINSLILADERVRAGFIFDMTRTAIRNLPWWMRPEIAHEVTGELMKFNRVRPIDRILKPGLDSAIYVDAANKPTGSSRGFTLHNAHLTEVASYNDPKVLSRDIIPAITKRNMTTIACMESTAEGHGSAYHRIWKEAVSGKGRWRPVFAGWWKEKAYSKPFSSAEARAAFEPTEDEKQLLSKVYDEFDFLISREQLNWRRQEREDFEAIEGDPDGFAQEFPGWPDEAFSAQGFSAFPRKKLAQIGLKDVRPPIWAGDIQLVKNKDDVWVPRLIKYPDLRDAPLWIWGHPEKGRIYYVSGDPSHGIPGRDYSGGQVWMSPKDPKEPFQQMAEYRGCIGGPGFAKVLAALGYYFNKAEIAPECNTITTVVSDLQFVLNYPRIYRFKREDKARNVWTNYFGWETNSKTREGLIDRFRTYLVQDSITIRSQRLLDECYTFVDDGSGKYEASGDNHDDLLMPAMIAVYCLRGIDPSLYEDLQEAEPHDPSKDYYNTAFSPTHDETEGQISDFNML